MWYEEMKVSVPPGEAGNWRVEQFTISEEQAKLHALQCLFSFSYQRRAQPGDYTRLLRGKHVVMSDTPAELKDHFDPIFEAERCGGHCLINGLGLRVVLQGMLRSKNVQHVTAIEISKEVIELVEPHYRNLFGDKFTVIQADAFEWRPPKGQRFAVVWHDIWSELCEDNLPQMHKLHRIYGRRCEWQGSWSRGFLESQRRRT